MKRTKHTIAIVTAFAALAALSATVPAASVRVEQYRHPSRPEFRDFNKLFLDGVKEGLISYSLYLETQHKEPAFCLPRNSRNLALTVEQVDDII
jgi:hypothetical protein